MDWKTLLVVVLVLYQIFNTSGCMLFCVRDHHCVISLFQGNRVLVFFVRDSLVEVFGVNATQLVQASPSCPALCFLLESSLQFWGEETAFLLLFNCACWFQAGHLLVVPQWCIQQGWVCEFCSNFCPSVVHWQVWALWILFSTGK